MLLLNSRNLTLPALVVATAAVEVLPESCLSDNSPRDRTLGVAVNGKVVDIVDMTLDMLLPAGGVAATDSRSIRHNKIFPPAQPYTI